MAVDRTPVLKRCKALGISPAVLGYSKETNRKGNGNPRKKVSEDRKSTRLNSSH